LTTPALLVDRRGALTAAAVAAAVCALSPFGTTDASARLRHSHLALRASSTTCETDMSEAQKTAARNFYAHIKYAHLQTSPSDQVKGFLDPDSYVTLHTIWFDSMISPFVDAFTGPDC
jgi:hypothetical protein